MRKKKTNSNFLMLGKCISQLLMLFVLSKIEKQKTRKVQVKIQEAKRGKWNAQMRSKEAYEETLDSCQTLWRRRACKAKWELNVNEGMQSKEMHKWKFKQNGEVKIQAKHRTWGLFRCFQVILAWGKNGPKNVIRNGQLKALKNQWPEKLAKH